MEINKCVNKINLDEVKQCNGIDSNKHYIILNKKVYDITGYDHPGGLEVFDNNTEDKYEEFLSIGHSKTAQKVMEKLYIGDLQDV